MNILKPQGVSVNIQSLASAVSGSTLVSVLNTDTAPALIVNSTTNGEIHIAAGERVLIEKAADDVLDGTAGGAAIYATSVAYKG
jgi:hypothetical protein